MTDQASDAPAPEGAPEDQPKPVRGEVLETPEGTEVPAQQNVGPANRQGGGEWPDPHAEPRLPAPGAADD
ncbi:MAG TPA: hypothetical protein VG455_11910, partial [Acidimicrobiales bacterium]|nr:hypothetical protein [Acidimicrobiales bacterium]